MATFTITIPDEKVSAVVDAFCVQYRRPETVQDEETDNSIPNPISKTTFAKNILRSFVREVYVGAQVKTIEETRAQIIETATAETDAISVG